MEMSAPSSSQQANPTTPSSAANPATPPSVGRGRVVGAAVLVPLLVGLALAAFAWPAARLAPRDLPVGVAGPEPAAQAVRQRLAQRPGAFAVHRYADEAAARSAIADREVYGAISVSPGGATLLVASAASPLVAQLLQQAATAPGVRVVDVVPADPDDPRGAALSASVLPLVLAGMAAGVLGWWLPGRGGWRVVWLLLVAALAGLAADGIAQGWLGILGGDWWWNAGALLLLVLAVAALVTGLGSLLGRAGVALGALLVLLVGNPLSAVSSAPELLPSPAGAAGQLLPPGAGATLLRGTAFFGGGGAARPVVVLAAWAVLGLAAVWAGSRRRRAAA
jgi:hypothetical protein